MNFFNAFLLSCFLLFAMEQLHANEFDDTRLINLHTTTTVDSNTLQLRISHRFGALSGGFYELWGLDEANMRIGFEYAINDKLMVGIGRTSTHKMYDGLLKYRLFSQSPKMPVSITYLATTNVNGQKRLFSEAELTFSHRLSYSHHIIVSKEFGSKFSMLLQPIFLHQNLVPTATDRNDLWALGTGVKYGINDVVSLTGEYIYRFPQDQSPTFDQHYNSFSLGMAFVTHGHYFSLHVTNSNALYESGYLAQTFDSWSKGNIRLGFNVIRNFRTY